MPTRRRALTSLIPAFALGAALLAALPAAAGPLKVVATFSILGDFVKNVGGSRVETTTLVGPNGDAHVISPTPADAGRIADAKLVVFNGLRFDGWITRLIKSSGTKAAVVEAAKGVQAFKGEPGQGHGRGRDDLDPHAWQSVANAKVYVTNIRDGLVAADPAGKEAYEANTAAYLARLDALDAEVKAALARIPPERRRIITSHDSFGYFARAYGLTFIAPQGVSPDAEASAGDVARIIQQIRREKIGALFLENITDARLIERIAKETGARLGDRLYSDALSPADGPAATYIDMMRHNIRAFSTALAS